MKGHTMKVHAQAGNSQPKSLPSDVITLTYRPTNLQRGCIIEPRRVLLEQVKHNSNKSYLESLNQRTAGSGGRTRPRRFVETSDKDSDNIIFLKS